MSNKQRLISIAFLLAASAARAQFISDVRVEPQPAVAGDNLTLVISGIACNHFYSPAQLSEGSVTTIHPSECLAPPTEFTTRVALGALPFGDYVARVLGEQGGLAAELEFKVGGRAEVPPGVCLPDFDTLCLHGGRFRVEAILTDPALTDRWGKPKARLLSFEGGALYFFLSSNPELFIKILDGCVVNGHYWLFVSGLTNLGVLLQVRDMQTGEELVIENPQGTPFPSRQDTVAFGCSGNG